MIQTRKRGNLYHVDCMVGDLRVRGTLGTQNRKEAVHVKSRLEAAVPEVNRLLSFGYLVS